MEPAGILLELDFPEAGLAPLLRTRIAYGEDRQSLGHVLSDLLAQGDEAGDILILHHDPAAERLFLGWILAHFASARLDPIWPVIQTIAAKMPKGGTGEGVLTTTLPHAFGTLRLSGGELARGGDTGTTDRTAALSDNLWRFGKNGHFPDAAASMRRRDYQCKPFRQAWKRYHEWRDRVELPARLAAATAENPCRLFGQAYSWDGRVHIDHSYTNQMIELPDADPASLRWVAGYYADDGHVWQQRPAANSPLLRVISRHGHDINNPEAIWEYALVEGVVGRDFNWLGDRWDTIYWTDKRRIYVSDDHGLAPLPDVEAVNFQLYGQCFGRTATSVFCGGSRLPLDPANLQTDGPLIWDDRRLFSFRNEVALSTEGLTPLGEVRVVINPATFARRVSNRDGRFLVMADGTVRPDDMPET